MKISKKNTKKTYQSQKKLAYLGTMATALAHEINQPVGSLRAFISGAQLRLKDGLLTEAQTAALLDDLWQQTERLKNIIKIAILLITIDMYTKWSISFNNYE